MKKALLVTIALVALAAWAMPLHPPTALADGSVEVTAPELLRDGSDLEEFTGPTVAVTAAADGFLEVTVMVSDIDLVPPEPIVPPKPMIEIEVCMEIKVCTDS